MEMSVTEIVFKMIASILEDIVVFVFDLPSGSTDAAKSLNCGGGEAVVSDEGIMVKHFPGLLMRDRQFQPVNQQGILPSTDGNLVDKAIVPDFAVFAIPAANGVGQETVSFFQSG